MKINKVFGPPGSGKTTYLLNVAQSELERGISPARIGYFSFTRKAATEAKERAIAKFPDLQEDTDFPWYRTLHSLAYRCLGVSTKDMMTPDHYREFAKEAGIELSIETGEEEYAVRADHPILSEINIARIRGEDLRTYYNHSAMDIEWYHFEYVERCYRHYKQANNLMDFTDLLERILEEPHRLPTLETTIIDEAQDLSGLQWKLVKALSERSNHMYVAGDDDQCQPSNTLVLTTVGRIPIQDLNPSQHRIICYDRNGSYIVGKKDGYAFQKSERMYSGQLITVTTQESNLSSKYTHNHHCIVRWRPYEEVKNLRVVYVMQKGNNFRIGQCQLFRSDGCVHAWVRSHLEKADKMWFIDVVTTINESSFLENLYSYGYGIPQTVFRQCGRSIAMTQENIDTLFERLPTAESARKLLSDKGLSIDHPIYDRKIVCKRRGGSQILIPQAMMLAEETAEKKVVWSRFKMKKEYTQEMVYSLDVDKHHNYFADGILTHNCIFNWAGASVNNFLALDGNIKVLEQSYRVPAKVHRLANSVVRRIRVRQEKSWNPRDTEGDVSYYNEFEQVDVSEGEWLIMAAANYMLNDMYAWLKSQGVLFERNGQKSISDAILTAVLGWEALRKGKDVPFAVVKQIYKYLGSGYIKRGFKTLTGADPEALYTMDTLREKHGLDTDEIWHVALSKIGEDKRDYLIALLRRGTRVAGKVRVKLSTIHGAKGGEADNVLLITDLSTKFAKEYDRNADDIHRLFYVGLTRARESLHIVLPKNEQKGFRL